MKKIKNSIKKEVSKKVTKKELDNFYVSIKDFNNKRKNLLLTIKDSLIMQEELEKIKELRKNKFNILNEIKKNMHLINSDFHKLKKLFPNIKNMISYTEKEIGEVETSISEIELNKILDINQNNINSFKKENISKSTFNLNSNKIDRIKNNLKVIESKLNNL